MAKITYIEHNGTNHTVDVQNGLTVMEGAVQTVYQELMQIVEEAWLVQLAMFMSKKIGLIR